MACCGCASLAVLLGHVWPCVFFFSRLRCDGNEATFKYAPYMVDGGLAVYVFFVLSEFALSTGYFSKRRPAGLARLALQRYLRLAIPIFAVSVLTAMFIAAGFMRNAEAGELIQSSYLAHYYKFPLDATLVLRFSFGDALFGGIDFPISLSPQAWTMPHEFSGSFMVFVFCWVFEDSKQRVLIYAIAAFLINPVVPNLWAIKHGTCAMLSCR